MSIERRFDIPLVASMALKEKQIQQNYRPIIAVHKWFARRPGTLFRGLLLAEFDERRLDESYFQSHDLAGKTVADPFMGGGTPIIEANRIGCDVLGFDINPMAAWIVREEIEHLDLNAYRQAASTFTSDLAYRVGDLYRTDCAHFGDHDVPVKYFLWVKTIPCDVCSNEIDLFPRYLVADKTRHPRNVLVCRGCGELNEVDDLNQPGFCRNCSGLLTVKGPAQRNHCACPSCGYRNKYPNAKKGAPTHRLFAIEYVNDKRRSLHKGRFFKAPDARDIERFATAERRWAGLDASFVPDDEIPPGDETNRLHRWGYKKYRELFNARQLLGLELSCKQIDSLSDRRIKRALATNLSDLLRYQNMLCRYDTMALKSLDIFSVHGFPVGLVQCESNILGIINRKGNNVGSGGWNNIIDKYSKAKRYCDAPFEVQHKRGRKIQVPVHGEWIGESRPGSRSRSVSVKCASSTTLELPDGGLDGVFTDPPYFGNVQYAELIDFCFSWLRRIAAGEGEGFDNISTRADDELTVNATEGRGIEHFTEGLAQVYQTMARALKPGAPFVFTYHHNRAEAYYPIGIAILDAGLTCSATLPCPAEMGGSIHIHSTGSSIIDSVFVCRRNGFVKRRQLCSSKDDFVRVVRDDLGQLRLAGVKPSRGDIRCIAFGHMARMAVWNLRADWDEKAPTSEKLDRFADNFGSSGTVEYIIKTLTADPDEPFHSEVRHVPLLVREDRDAVAF